MQQLEPINIGHLEENITKIDKIFGELYKKVSIEKQKDLEFELYYFSNAVALVKKIYIRNRYKLSKDKDTKFLQERDKNNSDLTTTKKVNKDFIQENNLIEMQEMVVERLEKKEEIFKRLANFINNERINSLAIAKQV